MYVEEDHFFHKLIVALGQTELSHVNREKQKSKTEHHSPYLRFTLETLQAILYTSAFITKIGIWVRHKHWEPIGGGGRTSLPGWASKDHLPVHPSTQPTHALKPEN